jgi:uncharacterized protein
VTGDGEYLIYAAGKRIGSETFSIEPAGGGLAATGHVHLSHRRELEQDLELRVAGDYTPLRLAVEARSEDARMKLEVEVRDGVAVVERSSSSRPEGWTEEIPVGPELVLLAGNAIHHLRFLIGRHDALGGGTQVLRSLQSGSVVVEDRDPGSVELAGSATPVRHVFVDLGGAVGLDAFLIDGRLVKVESPVQRTEAVLAGVPGLTRATDLHPTGAAAVSSAAVDADPAAVAAEDVRVPAAGGTELAGTLSIPDAPRPLPAAVLVAGSGPQDRNADTGPGGLRLGIFRTLADRLAEAGVATLRYDERGVGASGGDFRGAGLFDLADDAASAVDFLRRRPEIDPDRIAIVGHSEGGLLATLVAQDDPRLAGIALLGTMAHRLDETLVAQLERLTRGRVPDEQLAEMVESRRRAFDALRATGDWDADEVEDDLRRWVPPKQRKWFDEHFATEPREVLAAVRVPVAIYQGGRDVQVDPAEADLLASALDHAGHADHVVRRFPELDHVFMPSSGRGVSGYADRRRELAPEFLDDLAGWLREKLLDD